MNHLLNRFRKASLKLDPMRAGFRKVIRIIKNVSKTCRRLWERVRAGVSEFNALSYVLSYFSLLSTLHVVPHTFDEAGEELKETTGWPKFTWYLGFFGLVQARHAIILAAPLLGTLRFKPVGHSVDEKDLDMLGYLFTVPIILLFWIVLQRVRRLFLAKFESLLCEIHANPCKARKWNCKRDSSSFVCKKPHASISQDGQEN